MKGWFRGLVLQKGLQDSLEDWFFRKDYRIVQRIGSIERITGQFRGLVLQKGLQDSLEDWFYRQDYRIVQRIGSVERITGQFRGLVLQKGLLLNIFRTVYSGLFIDVYIYTRQIAWSEDRQDFKSEGQSLRVRTGQKCDEAEGCKI